ncbi:hypothetical protein MTR_0019s0130 [Medicago truncatula]|uniref:Uncharacterized protein n=1 Tax=Medicago truncatula TaxID=3880 RepID=A0A072TJR6_MEDTR|nr:hypothetical protein MTR_0019s0130 [Medicago truncatula]
MSCEYERENCSKVVAKWLYKYHFSRKIYANECNDKYNSQSSAELISTYEAPTLLGLVVSRCRTRVVSDTDTTLTLLCRRVSVVSDVRIRAS